MQLLPNYLSNMQLDLIVGSLLGDGSLTKVCKKKRNSYFTEQHGGSQKSYCYWKYQQLLPFSCGFDEKSCKAIAKVVGTRDVLVTDKVGRLSWSMRTRVHPDFTTLERKWYLRDEKDQYVFDRHGWRIKFVPEDLVLNDLRMAIWYFDDGSIHIKKRHAYFYTYSFSKRECDLLAEKIRNTFNLKHVEVKSNPHNKSQFHIVISRESFAKFIELVQPYLPDECLTYKVDMSCYVPPVRSNVDVDKIDKILHLAKEGLRCTEIAIETGINAKCVSKIIKRNTPKSDVWRHNTSGISGVYFNKKLNKWYSCIRVDGKQVYLGLFETLVDAANAREEAKKVR